MTSAKIRLEGVTQRFESLKANESPFWSSYCYSCLKTDERNRMSASQLLSHSFITPVIINSLSSGKEGIANGGISSNNRAVSPIDQPVHEEPVPDFSFFPGVPGKSRLKCDFEELQFLGKGGFGNVIKVCEIPIESQTYQ